MMYNFAASNIQSNMIMEIMSPTRNTVGRRIVRASSAFKAWSIGNREKPKSEILTIEEFERRVKNGAL